MKKQDINSKDNKPETVYKFILDYFKKYGFAPSFRDIFSGTGIKSPSDVREKLKKLERAGCWTAN